MDGLFGSARAGRAGLTEAAVVCRVGDPNSKDSYWPRNVFEALIPEVIKGQIEAVTDMVADRA